MFTARWISGQGSQIQTSCSAVRSPPTSPVLSTPRGSIRSNLTSSYGLCSTPSGDASGQGAAAQDAKSAPSRRACGVSYRNGLLRRLPILLILILARRPALLKLLERTERLRRAAKRRESRRARRVIGIGSGLTSRSLVRASRQRNSVDRSLALSTVLGGLRLIPPDYRFCVKPRYARAPATRTPSQLTQNGMLKPSISTCHPKMIRSRCIIATTRNSVAVTVI